MSKGDIHVGACTQIYGDILARGNIIGSSGCGLTNNKNIIVGEIVNSGVGKDTNHVMGGSNVQVPCIGDGCGGLHPRLKLSTPK